MSSVKVRQELVGEPTSSRDARRLVTRTLEEWDLGHLEDAAVLLVSEVVTNAVLHARTSLAVEITRGGDVVRVTVSDRSPATPRRRRPGLQAGTGRGLGLLAVMATDWGTGPAEDPWCKDVWFELPTDPAELPQPGDDALHSG
jgi:anti-sigma regulatory factor (Ser/Thr protein kinase)